jgi:hypothetical protein
LCKLQNQGIKLHRQKQSHVVASMFSHIFLQPNETIKEYNTIGLMELRAIHSNFGQIGKDG